MSTVQRSFLQEATHAATATGSVMHLPAPYTATGTDRVIASPAFYASHSRITDPGPHAKLLEAQPLEIRADVQALCRVVRGLVIHPATAHLYGVRIPEGRLTEQDTRSVDAILTRIVALDPSPPHEPRPPERRFVGCCRDFSVLLCALLRHQGIPARARTGCALYFEPGFGVDHWVCEYWQVGSSVESPGEGEGASRGTRAGQRLQERSDVQASQDGQSSQGRWVLVDPELDDVHCTAYGIAFDPLDVPRDAFLVAGEAWRRSRAGEADPDSFTVTPQMPPNSPIRGWPYLQSQVVRDLAALNKLELLCWDVWRLGDAQSLTSEPGELELLDQAAALTCDPDAHFAALRRLYEDDPRLRVPLVITTLRTVNGRRGRHEVAL